MLCARCHPHPFENWTQADYYGVHSFFNQVTTKPDPRMAGVVNAKTVTAQSRRRFVDQPAYREAATAALPRRRRAEAQRTASTGAPTTRSWLTVAGESALRAQSRESGVELLFPPRHHRSRGRPALDQPAHQCAAAGRAHEGFRRSTNSTCAISCRSSSRRAPTSAVRCPTKPTDTMT